MEEEDFNLVLPRTIVHAMRIRTKLDEFRPQVYNDGPLQKIGYGYNLNHGITEPVASAMVKARFQAMGQALMKRAFTTGLAGDPARFGVFVDIAERVGDVAVLQEHSMWTAIREKDYWGLHSAFLESSLILAYGTEKHGRSRVSYLSRILVEGEKAI